MQRRGDPQHWASMLSLQQLSTHYAIRVCSKSGDPKPRGRALSSGLLVVGRPLARMGCGP